MFLMDLLIAFVIGFFLVLFFSALFRESTPWGSFWLFLLFVVLVTWAGGVWIEPFGPTVYEVAWLPFLMIGIFITILLAATVPARPPATRREAIEEARAAEAAGSILDGVTLFFWIALILTIAAIVLAYIL